MSERLAPEERLALSRERLRLALRTPPKPAGGAASPSGLGWLDALKSEPGTRVVLEALHHWWKQYPLRTVGGLVAQSVRTALTPIAQRNPVGLMLAAFVAGSLLTLAKPWRWISLPAIFAGVVPHVLVKVLAEVPPSTWMDGLDAMLRQSSKPK